MRANFAHGIVFWEVPCWAWPVALLWSGVGQNAYTVIYLTMKVIYQIQQFK